MYYWSTYSNKLSFEQKKISYSDTPRYRFMYYIYIYSKRRLSGYRFGCYTRSASNKIFVAIFNATVSFACAAARCKYSQRVVVDWACLTSAANTTALTLTSTRWPSRTWHPLANSATPLLHATWYTFLYNYWIHFECELEHYFWCIGFLNSLWNFVHHCKIRLG